MSTEVDEIARAKYEIRMRRKAIKKLDRRIDVLKKQAEHRRISWSEFSSHCQHIRRIANEQYEIIYALSAKVEGRVLAP